jgi:hypothetical protein
LIGLASAFGYFSSFEENEGKEVNKEVSLSKGRFVGRCSPLSHPASVD